jgi:hypothetical protein
MAAASTTGPTNKRSGGLSVDADLSFTVEVPGSGAGPRPVTGHLTGSGTALEVRLSDPLVFAGRSDAKAVRGVAGALAARGLSVTVVGPSGPLVTLGATLTPWWQRRVTGSRHIRIERGAGLWSLARGRTRRPAHRAGAGPVGALPTTDLVPPPMLWPPAPTFLRRPRTASTTHDPDGGGNPRLIMAPRTTSREGLTRPVYALRAQVTTIGSDPSCDIRLPGLAPVHAQVHHDERDEFVLVRTAKPGSTTVNGAAIDSAVLRTASRLQLGSHVLSFYREEYADHGRPYGGRLGGELGRQRPQPPRQGGTARPLSEWSSNDPRRSP